MKLFKNALPLLSLGLVLGLSLISLNSCDTIDPVIEEVEELDTTIDGTYFYNMAALQANRSAMLALEDAIKNQQFNDLGEQNMLAIQAANRVMTDNLLKGYESVGRIRCTPPKCPPPNPCDNPNGIVCEKLALALSAISDFRLPETWAIGRRIEILDGQGEVVAKAEEGIASFVDRAVRYKLDTPETLKEGTLMIYEDRNGVETISKLAFEISQ